MKISFKRIFAFVAGLCLLAALAGCSNAAEGTPGGSGSQAVESTVNENVVNVEITMESGGVMKLELDREVAPITVDNFVKLADEGFYDGLTFHRVISGFMIQGGDPDGNGTGGPGYQIKGEFSANGWDNPISHERGVISMARSNDPDSAGSQFFIVHQDSPFLDGEYAAFGRLTDGLDVLDEIAAVQTGNNDMPVEPVVIQSIRVV